MEIGKKKQQDIFEIAKKNGYGLMSGINTVYSTAYYRLLLMIKSGEIVDVLSVETSCTILSEVSKILSYSEINIWSAMGAWGATDIMLIFQILGTNHIDRTIVTK